MKSNGKIVEAYCNYSPPVHVYGSVQLLLRFIPPEHHVGVHQIVLSNSEEVRTQIKGKIPLGKIRVRPAECRGLYAEGKIVLLMDRIFGSYPEIFFLIPQFKTYVIGRTLYHEIGHHIHRLEQPGYRNDEEAVADRWREKLLRQFLVQRYWYLAKPLRVISAAINTVTLKRR